MEEQWKRIIFKGESLPYEISDQGKVRRIPGPDTGGHVWPQMMMKQHMHPKGYSQLCLRWISHRGRRSRVITVHYLVAFAFLDPPPSEYGRGKIAINHKNSIKTDNRATNLEWMTYKQNSEHAVVNNLMKVGEDNPKSIFTNEQVLEIRTKYAAGESMRSLARSYKCSRFPIAQICHRRTWRHI